MSTSTDARTVRLDRVPPQNIDAERAVLGAMLMPDGGVGAIAKAMTVLGNWDRKFYREAHGRIYTAIMKLFERGEPADLLTVTQELERTGDLEKVGGVAYMDEMIDSVPTAENVEYYAGMVNDEAMKRRLIHATAKAYNYSFDDSEPLDDIVTTLEEELINIRRNKDVGQLQPIKNEIKPVLDEAQRVYQSKDLVLGVPSGFLDLDNITQGFQKGEYILLGGSPGMGKSTVARNIAQYVGLEVKKPVIIFSIETNRRNLVMKMVASEARIDFHSLRGGYLNEGDWPALTIAAGNLSEAPIYIDDTPDITPSQIRAKCQMFITEHKDLELVIVDHIHDVVSDEKYGNRQEEMSTISRSLKAMARRLDVPVIAVAQLSRKPENRPKGERKPVMSDLRDSGVLDANGDVIMFLYREDYYDVPDAEKHVAEIIVRKQRHGPVGSVRVVYDYKSDRYKSIYRD